MLSFDFKKSVWIWINYPFTYKLIGFLCYYQEVIDVSICYNRTMLYIDYFNVSSVQSCYLKERKKWQEPINEIKWNAIKARRHDTSFENILSQYFNAKNIQERKKQNVLRWIVAEPPAGSDPEPATVGARFPGLPPTPPAIDRLRWHTDLVDAFLQITRNMNEGHLFFLFVLN